METINAEMSDGYFMEVAIPLQQVGFVVMLPASDMLPVEKNGRLLCRIARDGRIRYRPQKVDTQERKSACEQVEDIATTTSAYMQLISTAPSLKASGLSGSYKLLAEFNGDVLAGLLPVNMVLNLLHGSGVMVAPYGKATTTETTTLAPSRTLPFAPV